MVGFSLVLRGLPIHEIGHLCAGSFSMGLCCEQATRDNRVSCINFCISLKDGKTEDVKA